MVGLALAGCRSEEEKPAVAPSATPAVSAAAPTAMPPAATPPEPQAGATPPAPPVADPPLIEAARAGDTAAVRRLVKEGADVNGSGPSGVLTWGFP